MPIKYALRTPLTEPLSSSLKADYRKAGYTKSEHRFLYEDVPSAVAEMSDNGVYALFSENGLKVSGWLPFKRSEELEAETVLGRQKPGGALMDSIQQEVRAGDYVMSHNEYHDNLELARVLRNLKTKTNVEHLSGHWSKPRKRAPESLIRIPREMLDGGIVEKQEWKKRFAVREEIEVGGVPKARYLLIDEATAKQEKQSYFGFFNPQDVLITGWIPMHPDGYTQAELDREVHQKKLVKSLDVPLKDTLGADILLGDIVFSNENHYADFMLCEVIGFTADKVRLVGYKKGWRGLVGNRYITLNWPKNTVKLPITISS